MVEVENGHATVQIDTTDYDEGRYKIKANYTDGEQYNDTINENSILTLKENWTEIGYGTDTPWTSSMMQGGSINSGKVFVNYQCNPMVLKSILFNSDFEIELKIGMDCVAGTYYFGFTKQQTSIQNELQINNTNMNNTTTFPAIFTTSNKTETIQIKREGNRYTLTHNNTSYICTVNNTQPVYLYVYKTGNCSTYIEKIKYKQ